MKVSIKASLNDGAIKEKVESYLKSPQGKKKMQDKVDQYIDKDVRTSQAGSKVITLQMANEMAQELCDMINSHAASVGLASSVLAHVQSATVIKAQRGYMGSIEAGISFRDADMSRQSVVPPVYGGVDNIVVAFEFGWHAKSFVHGYWHVMHEEVEWTRQHQDPLMFIHSAVDEFNAKYAGQDIHAEIIGQYS